ncbi:MAG TPA: 4'-phosphopantetheinyl transferase superfamily protein [Thermoleophilaceae bacterium]|jgi:4'-phosphopantetheinyl transferase
MTQAAASPIVPVRIEAGAPPETGGEPRLRADGVHVWIASLEAPPDEAVLSDDERERAGRYAVEGAKRRFVNARTALRRLLAAYVDADPAALVLRQAPCVHCGEPHGKPFLAEPATGWLRFNLSHSGERAVVAVVHGREVGVDVEEATAERRLDPIPQRWFTPEEAASLEPLAGEARLAAFYRLWTRKEAYLKATAEGIGGSLAKFDALALRPPGGPEGWAFADLELEPGYAGALAVAPRS